MSIKVSSHVPIYEVDEETADPGDLTLEVRSYWNGKDRVVIVDTSGRELTVVARDVIKAVENAQNSGSLI